MSQVFFLTRLRVADLHWAAVWNLLRFNVLIKRESISFEIFIDFPYIKIETE